MPRPARKLECFRSGTLLGQFYICVPDDLAARASRDRTQISPKTDVHLQRARDKRLVSKRGKTDLLALGHGVIFRKPGRHNGGGQIPMSATTGVSEGISRSRMPFRTEQPQRVCAAGQRIDGRRMKVGAAWKNFVVVRLGRLAYGIRNERIELLAFNPAPAAECDAEMGNRRLIVEQNSGLGALMLGGFDGD